MKAIAQFLFVILLLACITALFARGCFAPESVAVDALHAQGYSDVIIVEKHWILTYGCSEGDAVRFDALATNPAGAPNVSLYVCSKWPFPGNTIRTP